MIVMISLEMILKMKRNRFFGLVCLLAVLVSLTICRPNQKTLNVITATATKPQFRIVPAFCKDRLPDREIIEMLNLKLPLDYPSQTDISSGPFHPLQVLMPYLVTLDNRALLGMVSKNIDGLALSSFLDSLERDGYLIRDKGMAILRYESSAEQIPAPFISSMSQAGLVYLASVSYVLTGQDKYLQIAKEALRTFLTDYQQGGVRVSDPISGYPWYLEYASKSLGPAQLLYVLNGSLYALHTLAKTLELGLEDKMPELPQIYKDGLVGLKAALPAYEASWGWTFYDRTGSNRASAGYHSYQTLLLREIACRENDQELRAIADRWWSYYKIKLPYFLIPAQNQLMYLHLKGLYPHPYLRDEYATILVYRSNDGQRVPVIPQIRTGYISPAGTLQDSQNLEVAFLPLSSTGALEIWWTDDEEILGLPNLYLVDLINLNSVSTSEKQIKQIGNWVDCSSQNAAVPLIAQNTNIPGILVSFIQDQLPLKPWIENPVHCIQMTSGILPSRQQILLDGSQIKVTFRGTYDGPGPGKGWHFIKIVPPPADVTDYRARQIAIILSGLDIDPSAYPYLEIPVLIDNVKAITVDGVYQDGSRISRYIPINGPSQEIQRILINWESFPQYQPGKRISVIDLRIYLSDVSVNSGSLSIGPLVLSSGSEGILSNLDFILSSQIWQAVPNHNLSNGLYLAFFKEPHYNTDYELILSRFSNDYAGKEPFIEGVYPQPMTYALILMAETLRFRSFPTEEGRQRIRTATRWLIDNADLDGDGLVGWGLPQACDAFADGSTNPKNHPYTITTALVLLSLMDALSIPSLWDEREQMEIRYLMRKVALRWVQDVWTGDGSLGFFWYSPSQSDRYFVPNASAMFVGAMARMLSEYGSVLNPDEYELIHDRMDQAARGIISQIQWRNGAPFWPYIGLPNILNKEEPNDLVHHVYILWGMELYRSYGGSVGLPWSIDQAIQSLDRFWRDGILYDYPQDVVYTGEFEPFQNRPAILWGAGSILAFYGRWGTSDQAWKTYAYIREAYGPPPRLVVWPSWFSGDEAFYPRYAAHVLWGLANYLFKGK